MIKTMIFYSVNQVTAAMPLPDTSGEGGSRRRAISRRLRQVMQDALPSELPELAMPAPEAQLLAVVFLQLRKARFTHPALVVILVHPGVVSLL
jgi:hypothetical protein